MRISDWSSDVCSSDLGTYVSDFHLVDAILGVTWKGLDPQWPMRLTLDYVKNLGAEVEADTGYSADLSFGKASAPGDWRFTWGYAMAQNDAVLAAFSQDRSEEQPSELQSLMRISYAAFCLIKEN